MMTDNEKTTSMAMDDANLLVATLPVTLQTALNGMGLEELVEVVMDLGRPAEARFPGSVVPLSTHPVNHDDIAHTLALVGDFTADNRAGIERTLHRISAIRNRKGKIIGMTIRVGRAIYGTIEILRDLIETGDNLLFVGRPGVGKTTKLREVARVLADEMHKRVIVIDTSNEIAGDGDIPHPGIGSARRMQVPRPDRQHAVMIEAVENHMPEVIIVDEIGTEAEAAAARTIAERGVQLIGTAHGNSLENLIMNPTLSDLVGGVQTVTLGDEEARRRGTTKTVSERKAPPTFEILIEMASRDEVSIHRDTARAVDTILRGLLPHCERRILAADGQIEVKDHQPRRNMQREKTVASPELSLSSALPPAHPARLYLHGVKKDLIERAARELGLSLRTVVKPQKADIIIALRSRGKNQGLEEISRISDAPVHRIKRNTTSEIRRMLQRVFNIVPGVEDNEIQKTLQETTLAIEQVMEEGVEVALPPRRSALRKIQHRLITDRGLESTSIGCEPQRHLVVHPIRD
ncbi:R3H domain-containing nucleic acid-binding protein [Desulfopila inferna]|uniref:R3H domain-containing nucleic acid-binding protein n=1 Tax=Desulfopila inferna TaxID=468528 RepID=UPI0019642FCC|nr:R3H domain-containing nucleic acid-binding protein [Desulfopila inferna]MBM9603277.1 AAA family ATPase [Desulfopila inferna]